jgi:hypothetical protein
MISRSTRLAMATGTAIATLVTLAGSAHAFNFTTNFTGSNPKENIWLDSVTIGDEVISNFAVVDSANIVYNDPYDGGNTGAASADRGDKASGIKAEDPTNANVVQTLGNLNLNNILDGEDSGTFTIDVTFDSLVDNLLFWERGQNSRLGVQALDDFGNVVGNFLKLDSKTWDYAGFRIDTTEIGGAQKVGSLGVSLADLGVSGPIRSIRLTSEKGYRGPDFKVVGTAAVPEPTMVLGLGLIAGLGLVSRRRDLA